MRAVLRQVRRVVLAVVVVLLLVLAVTAVRVVQAGRSDQARTADVIVVLGAAQFDGRPQEYLRSRLEHAKGLLDAGTAPRVITVGGKQPGDRFTEGEAGRTYLLEHGVPADDVIAVGNGNNTLDSLRSAAAVMKKRGWSSAVVVTDPWHELRSTQMLADQGVTAYGSPTTGGPAVQGRSVEVRYVARESVAYLAYEVGRVLP